MMDGVDRNILAILQADGRTPNAEIARRVGLTPSAVFERVRKLEERGIIRGYTALLEPVAVGLGLLAFVLVRSSDRLGTDRVARAIAKAPEVLEVHHVAGEDCYLVKVRAVDTKDLSRVLRERFGGVKTITSTRTIIVLNTIKEIAALPIGKADAGKATDV